jgi:RNA polymerase sigma-70 factor, ECF subfamily
MTMTLASRKTNAARTAAPRPGRGDEHHAPWSAWSDEDLLVRYARKGTRDAFEELVHRYERLLYRYLLRYLRNAQLAEDVFQNVFLQVHLKCREFDPTRKFRPWLYRIATTRAVDLLRKDRRWKSVRLGLVRGAAEESEDGNSARQLADLRTANPGQFLEADEDRARLGRMVDSLPARLHEVVVLIGLRALPYQKAADVLGIPLGTVKSRMHEAMLLLRRSAAAAA